jgi:hypothetical protein
MKFHIFNKDTDILIKSNNPISFYHKIVGDEIIRFRYDMFRIDTSIEKMEKYANSYYTTIHDKIFYIKACFMSNLYDVGVMGKSNCSTCNKIILYKSKVDGQCVNCYHDNINDEEESVITCGDWPGDNY